MARWNPTILLLLCCVCWCSGDLVDGCSPQGPENCTFDTNVDLASRTSDFNWCTWKADIQWAGFHFVAAPWMRYPGLCSTSVTGRMTSRKSCSTRGQESCFFFRYMFKVQDEIDLNVYIQNSVTQSEDKVWSASRGFLYYFQQAYIPISTQFDFSVVIEATRRTAPSETNIDSVAVDDLQFVNSPCPTCFAEGPENCTFQINVSTNESIFTSCSWTTSGGWSVFFQSSLTRYVGLLWDATSGQLTSRSACSTNGHTHCLMFDYKFYRSDKVKLDVFIQSTGSDGRKEDLWSKQRVQVDNSWEYVNVSVNTTFDFFVIFEATRLSNETLNKKISVFVDNIEYVKAPCDSVMHATDSIDVSTRLNTFPQTSLQTTSKPLTSTSETPITPDIHNTSSEITPFTSSDTPTTTTASFKTPETFNTTPVTSPETSFSTSSHTPATTTPKTTDNVHLIAGLTVAVILSVFVIIGLLLVLHRRRCQDSSNTRPQVEVAFQNAADSIEDSLCEEAEYTEIDDLVESISQPAPLNILVANACVESSPDRRAESNNQNRNSQTTSKTPFGNSAISIDSFQEDTLADFDEMTTNLNINSPFSPSTALTDLAANIESPPKEIHDHHGIVENFNRKRSSQTFLKAPCIDSAANAENSPEERADYKKLNRNRNSQTTPKTPFQDSPDSIESSHEERAGYENLKRNRSSQTLLKTPITNSAAIIETSPEDIAYYEKLNRPRTSQTFPKSPPTDSAAANIESSPEERADYEKLNRNRKSQTTPKTTFPDSPASLEISSHEDMAFFENLKRNRSSQTFPKSPCTVSAANIENCPGERADYEKLGRNRNNQTTPKSIVPNSAANIESSPAERADYEKLNTNRSSQTFPKTPLSAVNVESSPAERADYEKLNKNRSSQTFPKTPLIAVNVESSPAERADYEKLNTNRSSQTFPKTPPTDSAAVDIESSLHKMADHETSQTIPKVPFTVETGAVGGSPVDNRAEGVVNDSVRFPSEMYSRLLSHTDQGHDYTELKSSAPASKCESEDG